MQLFHLGFLYQRPVTVNVIRDGVPTPVPYQRELFDYGRNKIERPLPVNLGFAGFRLHYPAERSEGAGRAHRLPRRELFPLPRAGSEIRPLGARPRDQRGGRRGGGVSAFPRILDRDAQARRRAGHHLRPARQPVRDRRLPVRDLSVEGDDPRRHGHALPAPAHRQCGPRSPHLDVLRGRERPQAAPTISGSSCTIRTGCSCSPAPASGSGAPSAIRPRRRSRPSATTTRAASA